MILPYWMEKESRDEGTLENHSIGGKDLSPLSVIVSIGFWSDP
jgi:hypothetical protein